LEILQVGDIRNQQNDIEEELSVRERTKQRGKDVTLERNAVRNNTFQRDHLEAKQLERIPMATHDREQSGLLRRDAMLSRTNRDDEIALRRRTHSSAHKTSRTRHRQSHAIHSHRKQRPVVDDAADGGPRGIEEPNDNLRGTRMDSVDWLANRLLTTEDKANGAKIDQTNCYHLSLAKL